MENRKSAQDGNFIVIKDLVKRFDDITAVNGLNLELRKGEMFGFLGPNGAGKTTTINMLSGLMKRNFRSSDLLIRFGGEEFVVVLSDTTLANSEMVMNRFREIVGEYWFPNVGHVTISVGVVRIDKQALPTTVLDQTDQALYYAKGSGRNRVCVYEKLIKEGLIKLQAPPNGEASSFNEKRQLSTRRKGVSRDRRAQRAQTH